MQKALLVLLVAIASLDLPMVTTAGPKTPSYPGPIASKQYVFGQDRIRWRRLAASDNILFPTKEVEDFISNLHNRPRPPGDAIVFPGNSERPSVFSSDFGYGPEDGPHTWPANFPVCGGRRQSPINVNLEIAESRPFGPETALFFEHYDAPPLHMAVANSGHSLRLTGNWTTGRRPKVSGYILPGEYEVSEVHFHWGRDDKEGSEHLIRGHRYPLEMHVVHYKAAYGSFTEATTKKDGLVVISYMFKIQGKLNPGLQKLITASKEVINPSSSGVPIDPFLLDKLAVPFTNKYASYLGSLTTPPCSEIVRWIINIHPLHVSSEQIEKLRELRRSDGTNMLFNFRPVQHLNGREIVHVQ